MSNEANTAATCSMINRHGNILTWQARGDGVCYVSDAPLSLDWIGVAIVVVSMMTVVVLGLRSIRWIGSNLWKMLRLSLDQGSFKARTRDAI
jgi:hypothetical protein